MELHTPRTRMRPLEDADLAFVFRHFGDPEVHRYLLDAEPVRSETDAQAIIEWSRSDPARCNRWAVVDRESGAPIGTCGFHNRDRRNHIAEIGFDLSPAYWGRGLMTEVVRAALDHGFGALELNRVAAVVHPENAASRALLAKAGFRQEAILRDRYFHAGAYHDHLLFSLLRADRE